MKCKQIERKLQDNGSFVRGIFEDLQFADNVRKEILLWSKVAKRSCYAQCCDLFQHINDTRFDCNVLQVTTVLLSSLPKFFLYTIWFFDDICPIIVKLWTLCYIFFEFKTRKTMCIFIWYIIHTFHIKASKLIFVLFKTNENQQ